MFKRENMLKKKTAIKVPCGTPIWLRISPRINIENPFSV